MSRRVLRRAATRPAEPQKGSQGTLDPSKRLLAAGWQRESDPHFGPWCWREPETKALYLFRHAVELVKSKDLNAKTPKY